MKYAFRSIVLLVALLVLANPGSASTTVFEGCYNCNNSSPGNHFCEPAYEGAGWRCTETSIQGFTICSISGNACLNPDYGGGGGGGTGGGTNCHTSGFCPAECFSCQGAGRPRI